MQTRKKFLKNSLTLAAGYSLLRGLEPVMAAPAASYFTFDLHAHPGQLFASASSGFGDAIGSTKTLNEMKQTQLSGAFFSLVADSPLIKLGATGVMVTGKFAPGEAWKEYQRQMKVMRDYLDKASVKIGKQKTDLNNSNSSLAAYLAVEGGDFLEGNPDKVDEVYRDGVRSIQLVHYVPNNVGDLQTADPTNNGLSSFGMEVVKRMNKLGMLIDVAHASFQTVKDVAALTDSPIMLSHSILAMEPDRPIAKRAISKEHAKLIAETNGIIGAWPSGFNKSFDEYVDNIVRLVDVVGIDHVGIGTDMDGNFKAVLSSYQQYPVLAESLKARGLSQADAEKVMGGNARRVLGKILH
ncbi:MAG: membrane dipeptidase [Cyclobacteriaceae bacterium]|nr:membrane dipeptidase [Cyclobacteriaceae bacterium]